MNRKDIWFGTKELMAWVPAPLANYPTTPTRWLNVDYYRNGGAGVRRSQTAHKELDWSWGVTSAERLAPLLAILDRKGPYYFFEPIAGLTNATPSYWATPTVDAPSLISGHTPTEVKTSANNLGYSTVGHKYTLSAETETKLEFAVPPGYTLHVGVHGSGSGLWRLDAEAVTPQPVLSVGNNKRTNLSFTGSGFVRLVAPAGTFTINGIIAQIIPSSKQPTNGPFLPGLGNTAMELKDNPSITNYSTGLPLAQIGVAASFVEVGAWQ